MSKGTTFETFADLPVAARARFARIALAQGVDPEDVAAPKLAELNERWRIVGECSECGKPLIAGELEQHYLNAHFPPRLRHIARQLVDLTTEERAEILGLFTPPGPGVENAAGFAAAWVVPS